MWWYLSTSRHSVRSFIESTGNYPVSGPIMGGTPFVAAAFSLLEPVRLLRVVTGYLVVDCLIKSIDRYSGFYAFVSKQSTSDSSKITTQSQIFENDEQCTLLVSVTHILVCQQVFIVINRIFFNVCKSIPVHLVTSGLWFYKLHLLERDLKMGSRLFDFQSYDVALKINASSKLAKDLKLAKHLKQA